MIKLSEKLHSLLQVFLEQICICYLSIHCFECFHLVLPFYVFYADNCYVFTWWYLKRCALCALHTF